MQQRTKTSIKYIMIYLVTILFLGLVSYQSTAYADGYTAHDGEGWSMSADGVMTIENNRGWWEAIQHDSIVDVKKLVIGKDLTEFRIYASPYDVPDPDFLNEYEFDEFYFLHWSADIHPDEIEVEAGNPVFLVVDGLLINNATGELVLSETGLEDVVIPEGVKAITYCAFFDRYIKSVQFPSSLERIGEYAFKNCERLTKIELPQSLIQLGSGAFMDCFNLYEVSLPNRLEKIEPYTFYQCAINYISIPESVREIDGCAFSECHELGQVVLPQGIEVIGAHAFSECRKLTYINFPEGLEFIERGAFSGCYHLRYVVLPNTLKWVGDLAFAGCDLSVLKLPDQLDIVLYREKSGTYKANPHATRDKEFGLKHVDTVIFPTNNYDFGYHAISNAKKVYFLGLPPENVGNILDRDTVVYIYCSDAYEFEWTRSKVASWVRQKLTFIPAVEITTLIEEVINITPVPTFSPQPTKTPTPTLTSIPSPTPIPTPAPAAEKPAFDPILFAFAGVLVLVIVGIVVLAVKGKKPKKRAGKKN